MTDQDNHKSKSRSPEQDEPEDVRGPSKIYDFPGGFALDRDLVVHPGNDDLEFVLTKLRQEINAIFKADRQGLLQENAETEVIDVVEQFVYSREEQWRDFMTTTWNNEVQKAIDIYVRIEKSGRGPENPWLFRSMAQLVLSDTRIGYVDAAITAMKQLRIREEFQRKDERPRKDAFTYADRFKAWMNHHGLHKNPKDLRTAIHAMNMLIGGGTNHPVK